MRDQGREGGTEHGDGGGQIRVCVCVYVYMRVVCVCVWGGGFLVVDLCIVLHIYCTYILYVHVNWSLFSSNARHTGAGAQTRKHTNSSICVCEWMKSESWQIDMPTIMS